MGPAAEWRKYSDYDREDSCWATGYGEHFPSLGLLEQESPVLLIRDLSLATSLLMCESTHKASSDLPASATSGTTCYGSQRINSRDTTAPEASAARSDHEIQLEQQAERRGSCCGRQEGQGLEHKQGRETGVAAAQERRDDSRGKEEDGGQDGGGEVSLGYTAVGSG